jgi:hypothetical protein
MVTAAAQRALQLRWAAVHAGKFCLHHSHLPHSTALYCSAWHHSVLSVHHAFVFTPCQRELQCCSEEIKAARMTQPEFKNHYTDMRSLNWSSAEKAIARKAFNRALQQELQSVIEKTKKLSAKITEPDDLWKLESYLSHRREEIDRDYDYRYSVLPMVFGRLIREGRLTEQDLQGLGEDKLFYIRQITKL